VPTSLINEPRSPWLKHYPPGMPARVATDVYASLPQLLDESFRKFAAREAAECMGKRLRYRDLDEMSLA